MAGGVRSLVQADSLRSLYHWCWPRSQARVTLFKASYAIVWLVDGVEPSCMPHCTLLNRRGGTERRRCLTKERASIVNAATRHNQVRKKRRRADSSARRVEQRPMDLQWCKTKQNKKRVQALVLFFWGVERADVRLTRAREGKINAKVNPSLGHPRLVDDYLDMRMTYRLLSCSLIFNTLQRRPQCRTTYNKSYDEHEFEDQDSASVIVYRVGYPAYTVLFQDERRRARLVCGDLPNLRRNTYARECAEVDAHEKVRLSCHFFSSKRIDMPDSPQVEFCGYR
jgi:hypothetical protein